MLNISTQDLASMVLGMKKEERFKKLKQFYVRTQPETKEFYAMFSNKRKSLQIENDINTNLKRSKSNDYENKETLNDVLDLIEEDEDEQVNQIKNEPIISDPESMDEDELLFKNFMNHNESIFSQKDSPKKNHVNKDFGIKDSSEMNISSESNSLKQRETQENVKTSEAKPAKPIVSDWETQEKLITESVPTSNSETTDTRDKYDKMLDDLFS